MSKPKINVTEVFEWECPRCFETNYAPGWLQRGDTLGCAKCKCELEIKDQYRDCRPPNYEGKKATHQCT